MSNISFEIALYNSPFFENLISELYRISKYKRNIYKKIRTEDDYNKRLSFEERIILNDLSTKENKILLEILANKQWLDLPLDTKEYISSKLDNKYSDDE